MILTSSFISLFWIMTAAVLAAVLASATRRIVPDVVWLLVLGMMIGEHGFALAIDNEGIDLLKELGLGFLFLLAGTHIHHDTLTGRRGTAAFGTWGFSLLSALGVMYILVDSEENRVVTAIAFAIALTSTALGTILPILTDAGETDAPLGKQVIVHGAVGELAPIISISLLLSARSTLASAVVLLIFAAATVAVVVVPARLLRRIPLVGKLVIDGTRTTSATTLRIVFLLLTALLALSAKLNLDIVLGAFIAGVIVRALAPEAAMERLEAVLRVIGYSFLIPVFFVCSGMGIDWRMVYLHPVKILGIVGLILVLRGGPIFMSEVLGLSGSGVRGVRNQVRLALFAAPGLPIIVAVTGVAQSNNLLSSTMASIMVLAGAITVLLFPAAAKFLGGHGVESLDKSVAAVTKEVEREEEIRRRVEKERERIENPRRSRFHRAASNDSRHAKRGKKD